MSIDLLWNLLIGSARTLAAASGISLKTAIALQVILVIVLMTFYLFDPPGIPAPAIVVSRTRPSLILRSFDALLSLFAIFMLSSILFMLVSYTI